MSAHLFICCFWFFLFFILYFLFCFVLGNLEMIHYFGIKVVLLFSFAVHFDLPFSFPFPINLFSCLLFDDITEIAFGHHSRVHKMAKMAKMAKMHGVWSARSLSNQPEAAGGSLELGETV